MAGSHNREETMDSAQGNRGVTGWVGWIWFAAMMLVLNGFFNALDGLVALFNNDVYAVGKKGLVTFNFTTWGWIFLLLGILQVVIGVMLIQGRMWARIVAMILVMLNAFAQIAFITAFPLWSIVVIALDVIVLWALCVHGEEMEPGY
jgi:hypothetical protein